MNKIRELFWDGMRSEPALFILILLVMIFVYLVVIFPIIIFFQILLRDEGKCHRYKYVPKNPIPPNPFPYSLEEYERYKYSKFEDLW